MNSFRKYFWQLISTLLALIAIFATYNVFFLSKPNKELQVFVDSPVPLVDINPEARQDIEVSYKGEVVNNIFLWQISIENTGNQPIAETDYYRPISFTFSSKHKIADVAVITSEPPNIGMSVSKSSEQAALVSNALLNPGDKVSIRFILISEGNEMALNDLVIDGRIVGVKEIKQTSSEDQPISWATILAGSVLGIVINIFASLFTEKLFQSFRKKRNKDIEALKDVSLETGRKQITPEKDVSEEIEQKQKAG